VSFDAEALRAARHQLERLGRAAVYLYGDEEPIATRSFVAPSLDQYPSDDQPLATGPRDEAYLKLEDVPHPRRGAELSFDATDDMPAVVYRVDHVLDRDGYVARVRVFQVTPGS
jgi:hypothetical protein